MPVYLVEYDLNAPGKDYSKIIDKIKSIKTGNYNILKSSWLVYHPTHTAHDIYTYLESSIDKTDCIFITQVTRNHSGRLAKEAWDWLNKALDLQ